MTNGAFLLVFGLVAVVCAWLERDIEGEKRDWFGPILGIVGVTVVLGLAYQLLGMREFPVGALVGSAVALGISLWRKQSVFGLAAAGALAGQIVQTGATADASLVGGHFVAMAVLGLVGGVIAWSGNARGGTAFAGIGALVLLANRWTPEGFGKIPNAVGSMLAVAVVAAGLLVLVLSRGKSGPSPLLAGGLGAVLVAGAGFFVAQWGGDDSTLPVTIFASILGAFATAWMDIGGAQTQKRTTQLVLGGLIFMGLATFAFAQDQSFGVAVSAFAGLAAFILLGRTDLSSVIGPVLGMLAYRTLRIDFPESTRSFDIAQHYGMVGVMIGAGLLVLLLGMPRIESGWKNWGRFGVLSLVAGGAAVIGLFFFGVKGGVGLLVGLGLGAWLAALISERSAFGIAPLVGLAGLAAASYGEVSQAFEFTRDQKMQIFVWSVVGLGGLIVALNLVFSDRQKGEIADVA